MSLWDQLNSRTLFGTAKATAEQVNAQTKDIHLEQDNRGALLDAVLINDSLLRKGRPIPGTDVMKTVQLTDNARTTLFTPNPGEQWDLMAAGATANQAPSAGYVFTLFYTCVDQDGTSRVIPVGESASVTTATGNLEGFFEFKPEQAVGENTTVSVQVDNMRGTTTIDVSIYAVRVY